MKKILLISNSNLNTDPRLINQAKAFEGTFEIHTLGHNSLKESAQTFQLSPIFRNYRFHFGYFVPLRKIITILLILYKGIIASKNLFAYSGKHDFRYWKFINTRILKQIKVNNYDLIWANDIDVLPLAVFLCSNSTRLVFDAHEYFLEEENNEKWIKANKNYRRYLFENNISHIHKMVTVNATIAKRFNDEFAVNPEIIINAKPLQRLTPSNLHKDEIHLVHHGIAVHGRNIEGIIRLFELLDKRFYLHFLLMDFSPQFLAELKKQADSNPQIIFHPCVDTHQISNEINKYDIGIYLLENKAFNNSAALPNKLFEFIQARLMVICTQLTEISEIVKKYDIGIIADNFDYEKLANRMNQLTTSEIIGYKQHTEKAAIELCAEIECKKILNIAYNLLEECVE